MESVHISLENATDRNSNTKYYVRKMKFEKYSVIISCRYFFEGPVKMYKTYTNLRK